MTCLGLRPASPRGRGDRAPPRQRPPRYPRPSTARRPVWACPPPGGAGSARPQGNALASPWYAPARSPGVRSPFDDHALSPACARLCHAGAETAPLRDNHPRAIPGLPPQGDPSGPAPLPEGRAPHARRGTPWLYPGMPPLGHRACVHPSMIMPYPGLASGLATRARGPRPSEKITFRVISSSLPPSCLLGPSPGGGAGSARP